MTITLIAIAWFALGVASFIYWWTKDHDFNLSIIPVAVLAGTIGPFAWPLGWIIHGEPYRHGGYVIKKKRK